MGSPDAKDIRNLATLRHGQAVQKSKETPKPTSATVPDPVHFRTTQNGRLSSQSTNEHEKKLKREMQEEKLKKLDEVEKEAEKQEEDHGYSSDSVSSDIYSANLGHRHSIPESTYCATHEPEPNAVVALASDTAAQPTSCDSVTLTTTTKDDTTEVITITELPVDSGGDANPSNEEASAEENRRNHGHPQLVQTNTTYRQNVGDLVPNPWLQVETNPRQEDMHMAPNLNPWQQVVVKIAYHHKMPGWTFHQPSPAWWEDRYLQAGWTYYRPVPIWSHYNPYLDQISYYYPSPHLCVHNPSQTWYYWSNPSMGWIYCDQQQAWKYMHPEPYELLYCIGPGHPPEWTFYRNFECPATFI